MKKVIILGSGALKIGEAGEFDYSGSQAIKALKEEKIETILINPNIATVQTSEKLADKVYFLPVTAFFVEKVIEKEKADGIILSFGGQTALNCGIDLYKKGVLKKHNVQVLGTSIKSIILTEDRQKFADHLRKINIPVPASQAVTTVGDAFKVAGKIGYPVMIRTGFALGGQKSGMAKNKRELKQIAKDALATAPQILVEKYLHHFKELEYEVVRDSYDNCVTVCNMENMDPLGIHTGESIVVSPSQTLTNFEYHKLREVATKIIRSLDIVGECNIQFAINPHHSPLEYYVIEVNARLSRSSALASKATGYPLAYVAAKLILGKKMSEVVNQVTKVTKSFFEPALDYLALKIPRWDLEKFKGAEEKIGSSMKSVGEVMALGRSFEEVVQKAVRMLDINVNSITDDNHLKTDKKAIGENLAKPTPKRLFYLASAFRAGFTVKEVYRDTGIDPWFLYRIKNIVEVEKGLAKERKLNKENLLCLKKNGFSDKKISQLMGSSESAVRRLRKKLKITPSIFQIDTLAGEAPARTNYLYLTYHGSHNDVQPLGKRGVMVLGSGPYRIGSSVEFDWSCVNVGLALRKYHKKSIILNCNPETVSTDYDISDRLYFEELTSERVMDIFEFEKSSGIVVSVGGQTPNNLVKFLAKNKVKILGTKPKGILLAEDRTQFSALLDRLGISQPAWNKFNTLKDAVKFSQKVGYPVLVRPSFVLSGAAMNLCYNAKELEIYLKMAVDLNHENPVIVSKFIENAKEIDVDGVAQKGRVIAFAIAEHIENAGVHSGDAHLVNPPQRLYLRTEKEIIKIMEGLAAALQISGPFNIQFIAKENSVAVIEMNLRASRSFPFLSKATGINFAEKIVDVFYGKGETIDLHYPSYVVVKTPQFSFSRLTGADPVLRVEMASTGEVACFGEDVEEAYLKGLLSTGITLKKKSALLTLGGLENKERFLESAWRLQNLGFKLYTTDKTHQFFKSKRVKSSLVAKVFEGRRPNVVDLINDKKFSVVINLSEKYEKGSRELEKTLSDEYFIRRAAVDKNILLLTDLHLAIFFVKALEKYQNLDNLKIKDWKTYLVGK
jgi:carbamoyl-phosphate synthase large subunit